jgi:hypothetical protein
MMCENKKKNQRKNIAETAKINKKSSLKNTPYGYCVNYIEIYTYRIISIKEYRLKIRD